MAKVSTVGASGMTIAGIQAALAAREITARELTQAVFDNIEQADKQVHAFLELTPDAAFAAADAVDAAIEAGTFGKLGPLAGVPVGFKDNMNMLGTHTTCSSNMLANYVSPYTATCVQNTLNAGAIPIGKLNMDEFAFGSSTETSAFGPTHNPWDLERVPGGSSGGSAAAVAAGLVPVTLGSDTGGSIRQPAAFCGVVGIKPTYGMVSRYGVVAFGSSLDQVGPFATCVRDAALAMDAIAGYDEADCTSQRVTTVFTDCIDRGVKGMKIGIVPAFLNAEGLTAEIRTRIQEVAAKLEAAGAELVEIELPNAAAAMSAYYVLGPCEAFSNLARFDSIRYGYCEPSCKDMDTQYAQSRAKGFGAEARRRIMLGSYLLSAGVYDKYYYPAQQVRTLITQDYTRAFEQVDCILTPVAPRTAFKFGEIADPAEMYLSDMFTISINIAGNGGLSVPAGLGVDTGLPVGVQLICPPFKDENMIQVAAQVERDFGSLGVAPDFAPSN
jgi:aspartyl-tRNA(Asn)/glutamyl-tRNA(Gln) amidotransferase subunit A